MTVTTTAVDVSYTADGATTSYALPFYFTADSHIKVYVNTVLQNSGYSLTGRGVSSGGTLVFSAAPAAGLSIYVQRILPVTQEVNPVNNSTIFGSTLARGLDYLTMLVQQLMYQPTLLDLQTRVRAVGTSFQNILLKDALDDIYLVNYITGGKVSADPTTNMTGFTRALAALTARSSTSGRGRIVLPAGEIPVNGLITVSIDNVTFIGSGPAATVFVQSNASTCQTLLITGINVVLQDIGIYVSGSSAAGSVIKVTGENFRPFRISVTNGYIGVDLTDNGGMLGGDFNISNCTYSCLWIHGGVQDCRLDNLILNGGTTSNCTGGCLRIEDFVSALVIDRWTTLSGRVPLYMSAVTTGDTTQPAYSIMANGYMDGFGRTGIIINSKLITFPNLWLSGGREGSGYIALELYNSHGIRMPNATLQNCGLQAINVKATCKDLTITDFSAFNNGQKSASPAITIEANTNNFKLTGMGGNDTDYYSGGGQSNVVRVFAGTSDRYRIEITGRGSVGGVPVLDGGTGVNKQVSSYGN